MKLMPLDQTMTNGELAILGCTVRRLRRNLKISQEALAEKCGLHRTYVCGIEGGVRNVSFSSLLRLAQGLDTTVSELTQNVEAGVGSARSLATQAKPTPAKVTSPASMS
jgi:transcriptional regulator with XRE-family HTH domain